MALDAYAGVAEDWSFDVPNDRFAVIPSVVSQSTSSRSGAGEGASALKTSLNRSTAIPVSVDGTKSVNNPSA